MLLDVFEEVFEFLQLVHFALNSCVLGLQCLELPIGLLDLPVFFFDFVTFNLSRLFVLRLSRVLLLEEGAKTDQVVLNEDVFLPQLFLTDSASFLLPSDI